MFPGLSGLPAVRRVDVPDGVACSISSARGTTAICWGELVLVEHFMCILKQVCANLFVILQGTILYLLMRNSSSAL